MSGPGTRPKRYPWSSETFMIRSIFLDQKGQLSFERQHLVNLSSFANAANLPFGILRGITGMTTAGTAADVEGAIWFESTWVVLGGYMRMKTTRRVDRALIWARQAVLERVSG